MYKVQLVNFNYSKGPYESLEKAVEVAKLTGFECAIYRESDNVLVATVSPMGAVNLKEK